MEIRLWIGFLVIQSLISRCYQQDITPCDIGSEFINGECTALIPTTSLPIATCPPGYTLYNRLCYINVQPPCKPKPCGLFTCPNDCTIAATTTITIPPGTTAKPPVTTTKSSIRRPQPVIGPQPCPPDSVLIDGKCRLIYCLRGQVHNGRCIEPVCTDGLVWTGKTCGQPEIINTILEIENTFVTEFNQTGPHFEQPVISNNVIYHTEKYEETTETNNRTTSPATPGQKCCKVGTPRMCKRYSSKWVCFSRTYKVCGDFCGNSTQVYIRVPKIIDHPPVLVMPPNPPLQGCADDQCSAEDTVDCSGCVRYEKEFCSSMCYRYNCPETRCRFIDQQDYCTQYAESPGCSSLDGCFDDWCSN